MNEEIKTVPRLKTIKNIFKFLENPIPLINETMEDMGGQTYRIHLGGINKSIMTADPEIIQYILQKNHKNYYKSELQTKHVGKYVGKGLLTTNGDYWLKQRRLIQPGFHKKKLESLVQIVNDVVIEFVQTLKQKVNEGLTTTDMLDQMHELTLRVVSKSLFSTGITDEQLALLGEGVTKLQLAVIKDVRQPMFAWYRKLNGEERKNADLAKRVYALLNDLIEERRASTEEYGDMLDMLLSSRYEDTGEGMTNQQILDEVLIIFVAGHETSATALTWTLYLLDQHPNELSKLRNEIQTVRLSDTPSFQDLMQLTINNQILSESMRLYPPAWITDRVALEKDEIKGLKINKKELIGIYIYGVHRSEKLWDSPEAFRPERFTAENKKSIPPFAYFPFGGGPRLCIGQQFAMLNMILVLYHFVETFDFSLVDGHPIDLNPLITLRPRYGMNMNISIQ